MSMHSEFVPAFTAAEGLVAVGPASVGAGSSPVSTTCLPLLDLESMIRIVSRASEPAAAGNLTDRKSRLIQDFAEMAGADAWLWLRGSMRQENLRWAEISTVLNGGWTGIKPCRHIASLLFRPDAPLQILERVAKALQEDRPIAGLRTDWVDEPTWREFAPAWRALGVEDFVVAIQPLDAASFSGVVLVKRSFQTAFSERERFLASIVTQQISWLHRREVGAFAGRRATGLGPRSRQVLIYLLAGESNRKVADKLGLSEHTVGDYVKQIYRHFGVNSRGELFALLISGGLQAS